jgi:hypothetical protein
MVAPDVESARVTLSVEEKLVPLAGENVGVAAVGSVVPVTLWNQSNDAEIAGAFAGVLLFDPRCCVRLSGERGVRPQQLVQQISIWERGGCESRAAFRQLYARLFENISQWGLGVGGPILPNELFLCGAFGRLSLFHIST